MTIYLYKKTHNQTGLKYLGKTTQDPHKYKGSGDYWIPHIKKHGYDVTTEIIKECQSKEEFKKWGVYYSELWNIVDERDENGKKTWANLKPESGDGDDPDTASIKSRLRVANGTHNWLDGAKTSKRNTERVAQGVHPFQKRHDGTSLATDRVADGTHNWLNSDAQREKMLNQLKSGTHSSQIKKTCEHCGKIISTNMYSMWHGDKCKYKS